MAKKNSKKKQQQQQISPERYMREKVRQLPIGKCHITPSDWKESGMANIIITRLRPNGNLVMVIFLVDTFCLGVKNATYHTNITHEDYEEYLNHFKRESEVDEISYNEAHNIIYGAMAFAEEGGIKPSKNFMPAGYILEEDTDDVPLIEYEFGKNGKHFLIVNEDRAEMPYYHTLKRNLGDDFEFVMPYGEDEDEDENDKLSELLSTFETNFNNWKAEINRHPDEMYSYQYPEYPRTLDVKHQFIADELMSPDNYSHLPRKVIDRILALPKDEAAEDISAVIMYTIGQTYKGINDDTIDDIEHSAIMHSLILLTHLESEKGLDAVLELMCQNSNFTGYHLGDLTTELIHPALYACGKNKIQAIEDYMNQPGLDTFPRSNASDALAMIIFNHPERREEIIEVFRRLLVSMTKHLPQQTAFDGTFAGLVISNLLDIKAKELIPEIKSLFATNCVDTTIAGNCNHVIQELKSGIGAINTDNYVIQDIHHQYDLIKKWYSE